MAKSDSKIDSRILTIKQTRMDFWTAVWIAVANSDICAERAVPTDWADKALEEFDRRFNN